MTNISKRRRDCSRAKYKGIGDHDEFLKRITKTLYYGQLPTLPCLSLPVTEVSCSVWSGAGGGLRGLRAAAAARLARGACVSPCSLVLALVYLERLHAASPDYLRRTPPQHIFLVSLMVGSKFLQDDGGDEEVICSEWAASGGIELNELKKLEMEFLDAIEWNVFVSEELFECRLSWLERAVADRQARARGFYTYNELASSAGGAAALGAALGAAAAAALGYVALLAAALALAHPPAPLSAPLASPLLADLPTLTAANVPLLEAAGPLLTAQPTVPNATSTPPVPSEKVWWRQTVAAARLQQCARWAAWRGVARLRRLLAAPPAPRAAPPPRRAAAATATDR